MLRPPQHRADSPIIFIHPADDAWDHEKINRDTKDNPKHPVQLYFGGHSRYDLTPAVMEYLRPEGKPTKFYLQRLNWEDWGQCRSKWEASILRGDHKPRDAYELACRKGLIKVEDGPPDLVIDDRRGVTWQDMQKLHEMSSDDIELPVDIGQAVYQASLPLTEAEKKA